MMKLEEPVLVIRGSKYYCTVCKTSFSKSCSASEHLHGKNHRELLNNQNSGAKSGQLAPVPTRPDHTYCHICKIVYNLAKYNDHINGIQHIEALKQRDTPITTAPDAISLTQIPEASLDHQEYFCNLCQVPCHGKANTIQHQNGKKHQDLLKQPLFRDQYICHICKISFLTKDNFNDHIFGKQHKEALTSTATSITAAGKGSEPISKRSPPKPIPAPNANSEANLDKRNYFCHICKIPCSGKVSAIQHEIGRKHQRKLTALGLRSSVPVVRLKVQPRPTKPLAKPSEAVIAINNQRRKQRTWKCESENEKEEFPVTARRLDPGAQQSDPVAQFLQSLLAIRKKVKEAAGPEPKKVKPSQTEVQKIRVKPKAEISEVVKVDEPVLKVEPATETPPKETEQSEPLDSTITQKEPSPEVEIIAQPVSKKVSAVADSGPKYIRTTELLSTKTETQTPELVKVISAASKEQEEPQLFATIPLRLPLAPLNRRTDIAESPIPVITMATEPELFLNLDKNPDESFVGVEYLVELQQYDTEPRYHCVLCDKYGDPRTIIIHISSTMHRMKYFDKHYPTMMKELGELRYDKEARVAVIKVLEEVSNAVEKHHGRLKPLILQDHQYKTDRSRFLQQIIGGRHFSEQFGPSFVNLVDKKRIANITRTVKLKADVKRTVAEAEAAKRSSYEAMEARAATTGGSPRRRSYRSRSRSVSPMSRRRQYSTDRRPSPSATSRRKRSRTPERRSREDVEKIEKYSTMKTSAVKEVETRYQEYELHPEKHPLYPTEWESFWNRRYKELQAENKDAASHDYKPEWIAFWIRRLKELFNSDVEAAKRDIKIKLGLPPSESPKRESVPRDRRDRGDDRKRRSSVDGGWSGDDRDSSKRGRRERSRSDSPRGRAPRRNSRSPSRSTVHSKRRISRSPSLDRRERIRELDRIIARLPGNSRSTDYGYGGAEYDYHYSGSSRDRYGASGAYDRDESSSSTGGVPVVVIEDDDEPLSMVSVLRILSALEENLGSLGTKTLDMLGKALAMEKAKANSSDDLMMTENNAVFFETIKEKLKGQLITGVLNKSKIGAVKKAIQKIAEVLHEISKKTAETAKAEKEKEASKRTIVIKVTMDKAMIAQRIALALVTEKKTDVTPEQLEILINVFFEMLRKSKELNKITTTQDYIELLEEERVQSVAEKVDILGIIREKDKEGETDGLKRKPDKPVVKLDFDDEMEGGPVEFVEPETEADGKAAQSGEAFTDSDLKTLLQNFRDLSSDEQQHLIRHLKKLEAESPERVEKLRKFVNIDGMESGSGGAKRGGSGKSTSMSDELARHRNRWSAAIAKPMEEAGGSSSIPGLSLAPVPPPAAVVVPEEEIKVKFDMKKKEAIPPMSALLGDDDDDEDDYSLNDVVKAAAQNLAGAGGGKGKGKDEGKGSAAVKSGDKSAKARSPSPESKQIRETHSLIANIMGSLQKKVAGPAAGGSGSGSAGDKASTSAANSKVAGTSKNPGSLPFYQQQSNSSNYKSTYQEQIAQQQQFLQYQQQQQQQGGFDQQQMMYQQQMQGQGNGNQQWWPDQNQMYQQQQNYYGNQFGGNQNQYPNNGNNNNNNGQNNYGNYY